MPARWRDLITMTSDGPVAVGASGNTSDASSPEPSSTGETDGEKPLATCALPVSSTWYSRTGSEPGGTGMYTVRDGLMKSPCRHDTEKPCMRR